MEYENRYFRGKSKLGKKWVTGYLVTKNIILEGYLGTAYIVEPDTIQQYTRCL